MLQASFADLLTPPVQQMLYVVLGLLIFFTGFFAGLAWLRPQRDLREIRLKVRSWWVMVFLIVSCLLIDRTVSTVCLAALSFFALRELVGCLKMQQIDKRIVLWCYLTIPVQYYLAYRGKYDGFMSLIPVALFLLLPIHSAMMGEARGNTRSYAVLQWATMLTVFSLSHIAFLLPQTRLQGFSAGNGGLVLYLIFLTEFNDVLQFLWGKLLGGAKILPKISPDKTWAGFLGGLFSTTGLGYCLAFLTPMKPWQSAIMGSIIAACGFCGDIVVSAIKRDAGVKDTGSLIPGHGGIMDRIDSLAYTSLAYFYVLFLFAGDYA